jgi:hypothetical protein
MKSILIIAAAVMLAVLPIAASAPAVDEEGRLPSGYTQLAQQVPLPKRGNCPPGTRESGGYCVAGEDTQTLAIPRTGPCPSGWITSGAYCTRPAERR